MNETVLQHGRILLVDDEAALLQSLADFLREHGTHVDTTLDGQKAIEALKNHPYTLLVTDIRLPGISGIDLLRHVKTHHPDIAVVLITGYASTETAIEALRLGAYDYIEKPFQMLELLQTVVNALEHAELKRKNEILIAEIEAHQHSLERMLENKNDEVNQHLAVFEQKTRELVHQIEALHSASDAIRDQAEICKRIGKGYPGEVNRLIRTCMRQYRALTEGLEQIEKTLKKVRVADRETSDPSMPEDSDLPKYVPEAKTLSDADIESLYTQLYAFVEEMMNAQQTGAQWHIEPAFALMEHMISTPQASEVLYQRAIQTPETIEDYGFENSVVLHSVNVAIYALKIGEGFAYTRDPLIELGVAALLHDVGMAHLPAEFFKKKKLDRRDLEQLRQHPAHGLSAIQALGSGYTWLADVVYQEHEREDGSGYPQGLPGKHIHPYAKIIGISDTYAGLTRARPVRPGLLPFEAVQEITRNQRTKFDSRLLSVLLSKLSSFPIGSVVKLNSGTVGRVIQTDDANPLRPTIQVIRNAHGHPVQDRREICLREHPLLYVTDVVYERVM